MAVTDKSEILMLVEVCKMYYEKEMTQAEIAKELKISRPTVSKMLTTAKELGIVKIEILSPLENINVLLHQLKVLFNLQGGLVIPTKVRDEDLIENLIVSQAALYVEQLLPELKTIGVGWGYSVGNFIEKVHFQAAKDGFAGKVFPIIGSSADPNRWYQPNELTRILGEHIGYEPFYLHAPAFPLSQENKELFANTTEYKKILELWSDVDAIILGIGTYPSMPDQATAARFGALLQEKNAVGIMATYFYDRDGNIITCETDIVIRIPLALLRNARKVIALCSGLDKVDAILGAIKTGVITHLITDEITARELIAATRL